VCRPSGKPVLAFPALLAVCGGELRLVRRRKAGKIAR
jgi:hypothetical protein